MGFVVIPDVTVYSHTTGANDLPKANANGEYEVYEDAKKIAEYALRLTPTTPRKIAEVRAYLSAEVKVTSNATAPKVEPAIPAK